MPLDSRPAKKNKDRLIGFRVDEDAVNEIENRAALAGKSPNDWCRDELLARLAEVVPLTANEELIHSEVIRYGGILVNFINAVMKQELTPEKANQLVAYAHQNRKHITKYYFTRARKELQEE
jgi:hypothetical protein